MKKYCFQLGNRSLLFVKCLVVIIIIITGSKNTLAQNKEMLIRIAEIEIDAKYLKEYTTILVDEAEASVRLEKGVISIFPMFVKEDSTKIRILEIYESKEAYEGHLKTDHFLKYKNSTLHMVKSLKLLDMDVMDLKSISQIFLKQMHHTTKL